MSSSVFNKSSRGDSSAADPTEYKNAKIRKFFEGQKQKAINLSKQFVKQQMKKVEKERKKLMKKSQEKLENADEKRDGNKA